MKKGAKSTVKTSRHTIVAIELLTTNYSLYPTAQSKQTNAKLCINTTPQMLVKLLLLLDNQNMTSALMMGLQVLVAKKRHKSRENMVFSSLKALFFAQSYFPR